VACFGGVVVAWLVVLACGLAEGVGRGPRVGRWCGLNRAVVAGANKGARRDAPCRLSSVQLSCMQTIAYNCEDVLQYLVLKRSIILSIRSPFLMGPHFSHKIICFDEATHFLSPLFNLIIQ
jgi:hypothetical protein